MLRTVIAVQFIRKMSQGKTIPCLLGCENLDAQGYDSDGVVVEAVVKTSRGCERGVSALVAEVLASLLAIDLKLPVPQPFVVHLEPEFIESVPDKAIRQMFATSSPFAFGSELLPKQFSTIVLNSPLPPENIQEAAEIFAFDILVCNPDRRQSNPNCLINSKGFAMIDHELSFLGEAEIGWRPPWVEVRLPMGAEGTSHLFQESLRQRKIDFSRLEAAFSEITPQRIEGYRSALPEAWDPHGESSNRMLDYLQNLSKFADSALQKIAGILQ